MAARRQEDGFTLVELLVATCVAGIGFLGLAAMHAMAIRTTAVGRNTSTATTLASQQLESLRRTPLANLASTTPVTVTANGRHFVLQATVTAAPTGGSKQVTSTVGWSDQFGTHQVQLVTVNGQ